MVSKLVDGHSPSNRKKHKSNLKNKDVDHPIPDLPCVAAKMVFFGDKDYQPDCPWKNSGVEKAIGDALDEWDFTDLSMEGDMINYRVKVVG
jgi:hypothetical protein